MLYVTFVGSSQEKEWDRSQGSFLSQFKFPNKAAECQFLDRIRGLRATGEDVKYIQALGFTNSRFSNIPTVPNSSDVEWFGDMAKFIIRNLV